MAQREGIGAGERGVLAHFGHMGDEPITITGGEGAYVYDEDGAEYLGFLSQLYCVNAGHSNEAIREAMGEQLDRIQYVSSAKNNDARTELADRLVDIAPRSLEDVFFSISGSEANEAAIQITLSPPFCIDEDDIETAVSALDESMRRSSRNGTR